MKRSELRQIIREEFLKLNETFNDAEGQKDLDKFKSLVDKKKYKEAAKFYYGYNSLVGKWAQEAQKYAERKGVWKSIEKFDPEYDPTGGSGLSTHESREYIDQMRRKNSNDDTVGQFTGRDRHYDDTDPDEDPEFTGDLDDYKGDNEWKLESMSLRKLLENTLDKAEKEAQKISKEEGVAQHVNKYGNSYVVEDWYDSDATVATYINGKKR